MSDRSHSSKTNQINFEYSFSNTNDDDFSNLRFFDGHDDYQRSLSNYEKNVFLKQENDDYFMNIDNNEDSNQ